MSCMVVLATLRSRTPALRAAALPTLVIFVVFPVAVPVERIARMVADAFIAVTFTVSVTWSQPAR